jgi:hypothetical protein
MMFCVKVKTILYIASKMRAENAGFMIRVTRTVKTNGRILSERHTYRHYLLIMLRKDLKSPRLRV